MFLVGTFLGTLVAYALTFQISKAILKKLILKKHQRFALEEKNFSTLINQGPSYVCSMFHCLINGIRGIDQFYGLFYAPTFVKLSRSNTPIGFERSVMNVKISNTIFAAYLVADLYHVMKQFPKLGGMDTIIHHMVFLGCSLINDYYEILIFPFSWLIIGEWSTVFLNLRWVLIKTGRGNTKSFQLVQYLFALIFFVTRVVIYLAGVFELFGQRNELMMLVNEGKVPFVFLAITVSFIGLGSFLNLIWFQKIAAMALSKKKTSKKQS